MRPFQRVGTRQKGSGSTPSPPDFAQLAKSVRGLAALPLAAAFEAQIVAPNSAAYQEARRLQTMRFARASQPGASSYLAAVDFAPEYTIPLVVRRRATGQLVGAARLELPGASIVEAIVRMHPGSTFTQSITRGTFAEIGGLATEPTLVWHEVVDILDAISATFASLALQQGLDQLFIFPRRTLMGLLLAQIPHLLPAYRFTLVHEVAGWREESPRLQEVRALQVKALPATPDALPVVYSIPPIQLQEDVYKRQALRAERLASQDFDLQMRGQMRQAQRRVVEELHAFNRSKPVSTVQSPAAAPQTEPTTHQGYLPFPASVDFKAEYLQQVMAQGGAAAQQYKTLSYELLQLAPGLSVLDVGCGAGVDLLPLAEHVGHTGQVVGLDYDTDILQAARNVVAGHSNILLVANPAEKLPFLDEHFDRVRADRVLQHVKQPAEIVANMHRILRPGGVLVLIEPDWKSIALVPGSSNGEEDDAILEAVLKRYQRQLPHALIGRQLHGLLMRQGATAWERIQVQAVSYTFTAWPVVDTLLQLSSSAHALAQEQPALKKEIEAWLKAVAEAHQAGTFLASIPLFFATAHEVGTPAMSETKDVQLQGARVHEQQVSSK